MHYHCPGERQHERALCRFAGQRLHGGIRTNVSREEFEEFYLTGEDKLGRVQRSWSGFRTSEQNEDRFGVFTLLDRFAAVAQGTARSRGLDTLSRSGTIVIVRN